MMQMQPYLFFDGRCEEAIAFYQGALGAEATSLRRFKDMPDPQPGMVPPGCEGKVMHADLRIGEATLLMSDGRCGGAPSFQGFSLTLLAGDEAEVDRIFKALGEGGEVRMPLAKTFFSPRFGMVADKFGVGWIVMVGQQ